MRIIAATNKNLVELMKEGSFRQALFYRLKVLTMTLPPLRDRHQDTKHLAQHFLNYYKQQHGKHLEITPTGYDYLAEYFWPGNVRELKFFIERLVVIANETLLTDGVIQKYWQDREWETGLSENHYLFPIRRRSNYSALAQYNSNITGSQSTGNGSQDTVSKIKNL